MNRQYTAKLCLLHLQDQDLVVPSQNEICDWASQFEMKRCLQTMGNSGRSKNRYVSNLNCKENLKELLKALEDKPEQVNCSKERQHSCLRKSSKVSIEVLQKQKQRIKTQNNRQNQKDDQIQYKIRQKLQALQERPKKILTTISNSLNFPRPITTLNLSRKNHKALNFLLL